MQASPKPNRDSIPGEVVDDVVKDGLEVCPVSISICSVEETNTAAFKYIFLTY